MRYGERRQMKESPAGMIVGGIMAIVMAIFVGALSSEAGSGFCLMSAIMGVIGVVGILGGLMKKKDEIRDYAMQEQAEIEAMEREQLEREMEKQELIRAVKSTIKVRCRYCGTLNEENEENCESCGAPL